MGKKKYYCDFCDRYFNDDKNTRTKHFNSVNHINLKKEHYKMFRDPQTILDEESIKKPCRKFHFEGFCPFGGACTYTHYTKNDLEAIRQELIQQKNEEFQISTVQDWLRKYNYEKELEIQKNEQLLWSTQLPPELAINISSLPPSVRPFHIKEFMDASFEKWGE